MSWSVLSVRVGGDSTGADGMGYRLSKGGAVAVDKSGGGAVAVGGSGGGCGVIQIQAY